MIVDGDCAVIAVDARIAGAYCIYVVFKCTLVYLLQMALSAQLP